MYKRLKDRVEDMFSFVEKQILFIKETTSNLNSTNDFLSSQSGKRKICIYFEYPILP